MDTCGGSTGSHRRSGGHSRQFRLSRRALSRFPPEHSPINPHKGQQSWSPSANIGAEFAASSPEIQSAMKNYKQFWAALSDADRAKLEKVHKLLKHYRNRGAPMASDREAELLIEKAVQEAH